MKQFIRLSTVRLMRSLGVTLILTLSLAALAQDKRDGGAPSGPAEERLGASCQAYRSRSQAQRKINSRLLNVIKQRQSRGPGFSQVVVKVDDKGRALIDISSTVTEQLLKCLETLGAGVISSDEQYHTVRAAVPFEKIEVLARLRDVYFIRPAAEAITH